MISSKVFVGNLSDDTTQAELQDLFSEVGVVLEIFLPTDQSSGLPRGFAFVEFTDKASVTIALEKLNGREFNGKNLIVSQAEDRPPEDRPHQSPNTRSQGSKSGYSSFKKSKSKGSRRNIRSKKRGG